MSWGAKRSIRLPLRGQRRLGWACAMHEALLLPVELRRANHEREHQPANCKSPETRPFGKPYNQWSALAAAP